MRTIDVKIREKQCGSKEEEQSPRSSRAEFFACIIYTIAANLGVVPVNGAKMLLDLVRLVLDPLPPHWKRRKAANGHVEYQNTLTGQTQATKPKPLAPGWRLTKDIETGRVYYWNVHTRETVAYNELPPPPPPPPIPDETQIETPRRSNSLKDIFSGRLTSSRRTRQPDDESEIEISRSKSLMPRARISGFSAAFDQGRSGPSAQPTGQQFPPMGPNHAILVRLRRTDAATFVIASGVVVLRAFGIASGVVILRSVSPDEAVQQTIGRHLGARLVSVNGRSCPRDPAAAMEMLQRARADGDHVDVELLPAGRGGACSKDDG